MAFSSKVVMFVLFIACSCVWICHSHGNQHHHEHEEPASFKYSREANIPYFDYEGDGASKSKTEHRSQSVIWFEAVVSTLLVSLAPFLILFFIPLDNSAKHQNLLKIFLSFASGGLLGDAFLHLIPHALISKLQEIKDPTVQHSHDHHHSHSHSHHHPHHHHQEHPENENHVHDLSIGLWVLAGIMTFLTVEKFIRIVKGGHGHSHSLAESAVKNAVGSDSEHEHNSCSGDHKEVHDSENIKKVPSEGNHTEDHSESVEESKEEHKDHSNVDTDFKIAGYLNLAADFTHNFTDGLAIGASYLAGKSVGIVTTVTILLHEVPHEIGDFAILIQSGCSKRKAMLLQLLTAFGAVSGTIFSLLATGGGDVAATWILPFTAGGFIYIATVSIIPELLENTKFWQSVKEVIALIVGVIMMALIAELE